MTNITLPNLGGDALPRIEAWALRRAKERSTWTGLAGWLVTIGCASSGQWLGAHADTITTLVGMLSTGLVTVSTKPRPPELIVAPAFIPSASARAAADPAAMPVIPKEKDMSIGSELKHVLGIVLGIMIPGASTSTTNLTTTIQNEIAKVYGAAATDLAKKLALDTTGMTGTQKLFTIVDALIATAKKDGFAGDVKILEDICVDIAQAAYRAAEPSFGADLIALASALTANPLVTVAAELVAPIAQAEANKLAA